MPHYYSEKQDSALKLGKIKVRVNGLEFELYSGSGVFSKDRLDTGTRLLIERCSVKENIRALDLGCGTGAVGISLKLLHPRMEVVMADVNERALVLAKKNAELHKLDIEVVKSDLYLGIKGRFDTILSNPPMTAGKKVYFKIIQEAPHYLVEGGTLQIVGRHKKGGRSIEEEMGRVFGNVETIAKGSGFRIYLSVS